MEKVELVPGPGTAAEGAPGAVRVHHCEGPHSRQRHQAFEVSDGEVEQRARQPSERRYPPVQSGGIPCCRWASHFAKRSPPLAFPEVRAALGTEMKGQLRVQ